MLFQRDRHPRKTQLRMERIILLTLLSLFVQSAFLGCTPSKTDTKGGALRGDQSMQEEHEHFPEHWPEDIMRASKRIQELLSSASDSQQITPVAELADLVGWLPVLAADSDLGREDFARIDAWSGAWTEPLRKHSSGATALVGFSKLDEFRQVASELEAICRAEQARIDDMIRRFSE